MPVRLLLFAVEKFSEPAVHFLGAVARNNDLFRRSCIQIARVTDAREVKRRRSFLGLREEVEYVPLAEEEAVKRGAELLTHVGLFSVGAGIMMEKNLREGKETADADAQREARRREKQKQADETLARLEALERKLTERLDEIATLEREILGTASKYKRFW